jgi:hypothetical protein
MARQKAAEKPSRISLQRQRDAGAYLKKQTQGLRDRIGTIKANCGTQTGSVFSRWRENFLATGGALQFNRPDVADAMLADPNRAKRLGNYGKAQCRMAARTERIEAEPTRHSDTFSGCIGWPKARRSPGKDSRSANRLGAGPA